MLYVSCALNVERHNLLDTEMSQHRISVHICIVGYCRYPHCLSCVWLSDACLHFCLGSNRSWDIVTVNLVAPCTLTCLLTLLLSVSHQLVPPTD